MNPLRIQLFDEISVSDGDRKLTSIRGVRTQSLFAYLVINHDVPVPRHRIAAILWPDSTESQARTNLRRELHALRRWDSIVDRYLDSTTESLCWRMPPTYSLDVETLTQGSISKSPSDEYVEAVLNLNPANLLAGLQDEWVNELRSDLTRIQTTRLHELVDKAETRITSDQKLQLAEHLTQTDPLNEAGYVRLIECHLNNNDSTKAVRVYQRCARLLSQELGVSPGPELQTLYAGIQTPGTGTRTFSESTNTDLPPVAFTHAHALIGRDHECQQVWTNWQRQTSNKLTLIKGEAGIGKTSIADEFINAARNAGGVCAQARAFSSTGKVPFDTVSQWLSTTSLNPSLTKLEVNVRRDLSRLFPAIVAPDSSADIDNRSRLRRKRIFDAMAVAVETCEAPLILFVDDLQWCDEDTLAWIAYLLNRDSDQHIMLLATIRSENLTSDSNVTSFIHDLVQRDQLSEVALAPLSSSDVDRLVEAEIADDPDLTQFDIDREQIFRGSGGNPLFVIELIRAWKQLGNDADRPALLTHSISDAVQAVIAQRLGLLSEAAQSVASVAAVIGRAFSDELNFSANNLDAELVADATAELLESQVLRDNQNSTYQFVHDCIREAAYERLSLPRRRLYHSQIATALTEKHDDALHAEIASHYERGGRVPDAIEYFEKAAQYAGSRVECSDALNSVRQAIALADSLPATSETNNLRARLRMVQMHNIQIIDGMGSSAAVAYVPELEEALTYTECLELRIEVLNRIRMVDGNTNLPRALELVSDMVATADATGSPKTWVYARRNFGFTSFQTGDFESAEKSLTEAVEIAKAEFEPSQLESERGLGDSVIVPGMLASILWISGKPARSNELFAYLLGFKLDQIHPSSQVFIRHYFCQNYWLRGEHAPMQPHVRWFLHEAKREEHKIARDFGAWVAAISDLLGNRPDKVVRRLPEVIASTQSYMTMYQPQRWYHLARAHFMLGDVDECLRCLDAGLGCAESTGQHFWDAEFLRMKALTYWQRDPNADQIDRTLDQALMIAIGQKAGWFELKTRLNQCQLIQARGDDATTSLRQFLVDFAAQSLYPHYELAQQTLAELEGIPASASERKLYLVEK